MMHKNFKNITPLGSQRQPTTTTVQQTTSSRGPGKMAVPLPQPFWDQRYFNCHKIQYQLTPAQIILYPLVTRNNYARRKQIYPQTNKSEPP